MFTTEGRIDKQTAYGKAVATVAECANRQGVPVIGLAASLGQGYEALYESGISAILPLPDTMMTTTISTRHAEELLAAAERAMRLVDIGCGITEFPVQLRLSLFCPAKHALTPGDFYRLGRFL